MILCLPLVAGACNDEASKTVADSPQEKAPLGEKSPVANEAPAEKLPAVSAAPAPKTTFELEGFGFILDAPADWPLKRLDEAVFLFELEAVKEPGKPTLTPSLTIRKSAFGFTTPEDASSYHQGKLLDSGSKGALLYQNCESEMAGLVIRTVKYVVKEGESFFTCTASGLDLALMNQVCSSLRKN